MVQGFGGLEGLGALFFVFGVFLNFKTLQDAAVDLERRGQGPDSSPLFRGAGRSCDGAGKFQADCNF